MHLETIDFNKMYIEQKKKTSFQAKNKEAWNKKASSMNQHIHNSMYNQNFLNHINLEGINSSLDIGCGPGNLSLLLSKKLKNIYCLDFSNKMLELLQENAKKENCSNIKSFNLSWYDDWSLLPKADLVIASRSMEVKNMQEALEKLDKQALKKVVLSYKVGGSFLSEDILKVLNKDINKKPDYIYIINILYKMGIKASLNFIKSEGRNTQYKNEEDFITSVSWSLGTLKEEEKNLLKEYYETRIKNQNQSDTYVEWAIIAWDKK